MKTLLLLALAIALSGCATVHGLASDGEKVTSYIRRATQSSVDAQREGRFQSAMEDRAQRLDMAASLVINNEHTARQ